METLTDALNKICLSKNYKNLYDFLKKHDPDANAYIGQIDKRTRIPAETRLAKWFDALGVSEDERENLLKAAAIDRVYAAAKRNAVLRDGLNFILDELELVRGQVAESRIEIAKLHEKITDLLSGGRGRK